MAEATIKNAVRPEDSNPPFFCSPLTDEDKKILLANSRTDNFDTGFIKGVAVRCSAEYPQVLVCKPFMSDNTPFPTLFWLVCPYLDKLCAELETEHKIPQFEKELEANRETVEKWHEEYAKLRAALIAENSTKNIKNLSAIIKSFGRTGVGGINRFNNPCAAKCLHLQTATMLAWKHPAEAWLRKELGCTECGEACCKEKL